MLLRSWVRTAPLLLLLLLLLCVGSRAVPAVEKCSTSSGCEREKSAGERTDDAGSDETEDIPDPGYLGGPCPYNASVDLDTLLARASIVWRSRNVIPGTVTYGHCDTPFYEGDIFLDGIEPWSDAEDSDDGADLAKDRVHKWEGGVVPYELSFPNKGTELDLLDSMRAIEQATAIDNVPCVSFRPRRPSDRDFVFMTNLTSHCSFSAIGRRGNNQTLNVAAHSQNPGQMKHLLLHVLGLWHENNRPGRNATIEVLQENIRDGYSCFFQEYSDVKDPTEYLYYDLESVTHARPDIFGKDGEYTLQPRNTKYNKTKQIGQAWFLSRLDIDYIRSFYDCYRPPTTTTQITTTSTQPTTSKPYPQRVCEEQPYYTQVFFAYPEDCHKFIQCFHQIASVHCCSPGWLVWSEGNTTCMFPGDTPCDTPHVKSECMQGNRTEEDSSTSTYSTPSYD